MAPILFGEEGRDDWMLERCVSAVPTQVCEFMSMSCVCEGVCASVCLCICVCAFVCVCVMCHVYMYAHPYVHPYVDVYVFIDGLGFGLSPLTIGPLGGTSSPVLPTQYAVPLPTPLLPR